MRLILPVIFPVIMAVLMALPAQARPFLKLGSQGVDVLEVQALLQLLGFYDGDLNGNYNEALAKSVSEFQKSAGIAQDGKLGEATWNKLLPSSPNESPKADVPSSEPKKTEGHKNTQKPTEDPNPILRRGAKGDAVYRLQQRLVKLGFLGISPDGDFGELTEKAVKAAQQKYKLEADGIVGGATWNAIGL